MLPVLPFSHAYVVGLHAGGRKDYLTVPFLASVSCLVFPFTSAGRTVVSFLDTLSISHTPLPSSFLL